MDHTKVLASMEAMISTFNSKMAEFEAELKQNAARKPPNTIAALNTEYQGFKTFVHTAITILRAEVDALARGQDRLEMHQRRKILLVHGVPEADKEDISAGVVATFAAKCKMSDLTVNCIQYSHRLGKKEAKSKPRPIVVKFADKSVRDRVWNSKKALKGSKVTLSEFLTKPRHTVFMAARDYYGVSACWTRDGWIHIKTPDGKKRKIESMADFRALCVEAPVSA
ncbi:hypothetical protein NE865_00832 [Phthorimaea operculella]|nr:hypothetical protein NE865_00832 [Phthorimaea operculella]